MSVIKDYNPRTGPSYTPSPTGNVADLSHGTDGQLLIGQTAASTAYKTITGDVTIDKDGVTAIGAAKVLGTMLAHGTDGQLLVGQTGAATAYKSVTGDVTITNNGVTAIGAGKVLDSMLAALSASAGLSRLGIAHFKYDFSVDGGAQGEIIPASSPTLPNKAIVLWGIANVTTALLAAGGASTIAIGTHAGSAVNSLKVAASKTTYSLNAFLDLIPAFTAASVFKMSAAGQISITVATNDLTAGVMEAWVAYVTAGT